MASALIATITTEPLFEPVSVNFDDFNHFGSLAKKTDSVPIDLDLPQPRPHILPLLLNYKCHFLALNLNVLRSAILFVQIHRKRKLEHLWAVLKFGNFLTYPSVVIEIILAPKGADTERQSLSECSFLKNIAILTHEI